MFFTIKRYSRIFGCGKSTRHRDPRDTNLGSRVKLGFLVGSAKSPFADPIGFFKPLSLGKPSFFACSLLFDLIFFSTITADRWKG
jgi:hypothetical protein